MTAPSRAETKVAAPERAQTFPNLERWYVRRSAILKTIELRFKLGERIVLLEESQGFGKTVVAAQYAMQAAGRCICLFINPDDTLLCTPDALRRDVYTQAYRIINASDPALPEMLPTGAVRALLSELHSHSKDNKQSAVFVVDGLSAIEAEEHRELRDAVLEMLSFGSQAFHFLLTRRPDSVPFPIPDRVPNRTLSLQVLTREEVGEILGGAYADDVQLDQAVELTQGIPWKVATIRELIDSGKQLSAIVTDAPGEESEWWQLEWRDVREADEEELLFLAFRAIDARPRSLAETSSILGISELKLRAICARLTFLRIDGDAAVVHYRNEGLRNFAAKRLERFSRRVYDLLIADLVAQPAAPESITGLPEVLARAQRWDQLLTVLTPEHFEQLMAIAQSVAAIRQRASLGVRAAVRRGYDGDLLRFGLHASTIAGIEADTVWSAEIDARLALGDFLGATRLAQDTQSVEDRLHLLAIVSKARREASLPPDAVVDAEIRELVRRLNFDELGSRAIDIAADLFHTAPDLAISLVDSSVQRDPGVASPDWAFAKLALESSLARSRGGENVSEQHTVDTRIQDPIARRFAAEMAVVLEGRTSDQVMATASRLADPADQLYVLRKWLEINAEREDAIVVADHAMQLATRTSSYSISCEFLLDLAVPLRHSTDVDRVAKLIGEIDQREEEAASKSRVASAVALQMQLVLAEERSDEEAAIRRLERSYHLAADQSDLQTRIECESVVLAGFASLSGRAGIERSTDIERSTMVQLREDIDALLAGTAYHADVTHDVIVALAPSHSHLAEEIARKLNTASRREQALALIAITRVDDPDTKLDAVELERYRTWLTDPTIIGEFLSTLAERLSSDKAVDETLARRLRGLLAGVHEISGAPSRIRSYADLLDMGHRVFLSPDPWVEGLEARAVSEWEQVDAAWNRTDVGYALAKRIATYDRAKALAFMSSVERFRDVTPVHSRPVAQSLIWMVTLVVRALEGFLVHNLPFERALGALVSLISRVPAQGVQARLFGDVAVLFARRAKLDMLKTIVADYVRPAIRAIGERDGSAMRASIVQCAPVLFLAHRSLAFEEIDRLAPVDRESAYHNICHFILHGYLRGEPFESTAKGSGRLSHENCVDIAEVLERCDDDITIWWTMARVAELSSSPKSRLTQDQRVDIAGRFEAVARRLPSARGIQHEGPSIVARAAVTAIRGAKKEEWEELIRRARNVPNTSDRCFVLYHIADLLPRRYVDLRPGLVKEAIELAGNIPSLLDRSDRLIHIAETFAVRERQYARSAIRAAAHVCAERDDDRAVRARQRVLDIAHTIDESLVSALISQLDPDPARAEAKRDDRIASRRKLSSQVRVTSLRKALGNPRDMDRESLVALRPREINQACHGALASLNAELRHPVALDEQARQLIATASALPLVHSYWVYAWGITNIARRQSGSSGQHLVQRVFEATLRGAEVVWSFGAQMTNRHTSLVGAALETAMVVDAGDRERAFVFIREWLSQRGGRDLTICDPYFGPDDLDFVALVQDCCPGSRITVLTSRKRQLKEGARSTWPGVYSTAWCELTDQDPPECDVVVCGDDHDGSAPFHDRWLLVGGEGLSVGTSSHSLGISKLSRVGPLSAGEYEVTMEKLSKYLDRSARIHGDRKLLYDLFTLERAAL